MKGGEIDEATARLNGSKALQSKTKAAKDDNHWLIFLLVACNYCQMDNEIILSFFMLAQSNVGCDYITTVAKMRTLQYVVTLAWRPLSGYITDATAHVADWVLMITTVIELLSLMMLIGAVWTVGPGNYSTLYVVIIQLIKSMCETQLYNSVWKIFKMRLEYRFNIGTGSQCKVLSRIGLLGEQAELWYNLFVFGAAILYIKSVTIPSMLVVQYWFFGAVMVSTAIMLFCAGLMIWRGDYFTAPDLAATVMSPGAIDVNMPSTDFHRLAGDEEECRPRMMPRAGLAGSRRSSISRSRRDSQAWLPAREGKSSSPIAVWSYLCESSKYLWNNVVARHVIIHSLLLFIPYSLVNSTVFFAMPGRHTTHVAVKTAENFCGGYISNTLMQDTVLNAVYVTATFVYLYGLIRIPGHLYYTRANPIFMVLLAAISLLMVFHLDQMLEYWVLSITVASCWFLFMYNNFLATAAVDQKYYGFYSFVIGYVQTLPNILGFWLMAYKIPPRYILYVSMGLFVICGVYGRYIGKLNYEELKKSSKEGGC